MADDLLKANDLNVDALSLYEGKVMHARMKPIAHRFTYRVFNILIDLDQLSDAGRKCSLFSVGRWNLFSFFEKDHGKRDGSSLRAYIDGLTDQVGLDKSARIQLLCYPRIFGYTFNPLSVYYCFDQHEKLSALIYQVHNTFGECHTYVEPVQKGQLSKAGARQETSKLFYVSPFMDMEMKYKFRISEPGKTIRQRILETDADGPILSATLSALNIPANNTQFLRALLQTAGLTWKVTAGIHWEALKLWLKGMKLRSKPAPPPPESFAVDRMESKAGIGNIGNLPAPGE